MSKPLTANQERIAKLSARGRTIKQISIITGKTENNVSRTLRVIKDKTGLTGVDLAVLFPKLYVI